MTTTPNAAVEAAERRVAELREERERTAAALEVAGRDVAPAEEARDAAQRVYDGACAELVRAQAQAAGVPDAEAAFRQADAELGAALVAETEARKRVGDLKMHARYLDGLTAQAEADLERARRAASPGRDLLARIRAKVAGG